VDPLDVLGSVEPPVDPGLIGHADDEIPALPDKAERRADPPEQLEPVGVLEVVEVRVERPVPVDEQRPP